MKTITSFISASNMKQVYTDAVIEFANKTTGEQVNSLKITFKPNLPTLGEMTNSIDWTVSPKLK